MKKLNLCLSVFIRIICIVFIAGSAFGKPINAGFEDGLTGYSVSGNVQILTGELGAISPTEGNSLVCLSTGPFDVLNDGLPDQSTLVSDLFLIETGAQYLTFDYNFITEEFTGADALAFDYFTAELITSAGTETLASMDTTYSGFSSINNGTPLVTADGSLFFDHTGVINVSYDISAFAGMDASLQFLISDEYDGSFDSGVLIDNINISSYAAPVPEPASMLLLGLGLVLISSIQRKKTVNNSTK